MEVAPSHILQKTPDLTTDNARTESVLQRASKRNHPLADIARRY